MFNSSNLVSNWHLRIDGAIVKEMMGKKEIQTEWIKGKKTGWKWPEKGGNHFWKFKRLFVWMNFSKIFYFKQISQEITIFWVFGITQPGIEPQSPGPLANTLSSLPLDWLDNLLNIILSWHCIIQTQLKLWHLNLL